MKIESHENSIVFENAQAMAKKKSTRIWGFARER